MSSSTNSYVIFDCNGSSDDAWALALLLKAHRISKIKLLAITCVPGPIKRNTVARNMRKALLALRSDDIPIYLGAASRFMPDGYDTDFHHQHHHDNHHREKDAFDEILPADFMGERAIESKHAVKAIRDLVYQYRNQVTIISTGPLTNVALTLAMYGSQYASWIKALYIMGGAYQAVGNVTRDAEANFYMDPEAAQIVLARAKCPITILPFEACVKDRFRITGEWRCYVLGANHQDDFILLMNNLESALLGGDPRNVFWIPYDAMIVAAFLFRIHFVGVRNNWNAKVELFGKYTRGEMIIDHLKNLLKNPINATIIENVDADMFKMIAMWATGNSGPDSDYIQGLL